MNNKFKLVLFNVVLSLIQASDGGYVCMKINENTAVNNNQITKVQLFYECLCPACRQFDTTEFGQTIQELHPYLDINAYPYGNAETRKENDKLVFKCPHGPKECYGNMLHACAIDYLKNQTRAVLYNTCMMSLNYTLGSDDVAAQECGNKMNIDSKPIIACAEGDRGPYLLNKIGEISKKVNFQYVPYVLINGKVFTQGKVSFKEAVCKTFENPPPQCK